MKFLVDACVDTPGLRALLSGRGHDVRYAAEIGPRTPDDLLLAQAAQQERALITADKDFGVLVFVHRMPHAGVVRLTDMSDAQRIVAMREVLDNYSTALSQRAMLVVSLKRVRVSHAEPDGGGGNQVSRPRRER